MKWKRVRIVLHVWAGPRPRYVWLSFLVAEKLDMDWFHESLFQWVSKRPEVLSPEESATLFLQRCAGQVRATFGRSLESWAEHEPVGDGRKEQGGVTIYRWDDEDLHWIPAVEFPVDFYEELA